MASYYTDNRNATTPAQTNVASTPKTMTSFYSAGSGRGQMYECEVGADGAPNATDCQIVYSFERMTVLGTGGVSSVLNPLVIMNPADVSRTLARINETSEGTITALSGVLRMALNQRASQRWIAAPGKELVWPNTANSGLAGRALSPTYAAPVLIAVYVDDL